MPSAPPQNVSVNVSTSTTALLHWLPPETELQNGIIQYYIINLYNTDTGRTSITSSSPESLSYLLTNLHPFNTYACNIAAVTVGSGPSSRNISFQMLEDG